MTDEEISESDYEDGPPCADCGHACLDHDDEFGQCRALGLTNTLHEVCTCQGYREPDEDAA